MSDPGFQIKGMTQKKLCRLCVTLCQEHKLLYDEEGHSNEVYELMTKYFKETVLNTEEGNNLTVMCLECWSRIIDFHNFYLLVDQAQKTIFKKMLEIDINSDKQFEIGDDCAYPTDRNLHINDKLIYIKSEDEGLPGSISSIRPNSFFTISSINKEEIKKNELKSEKYLPAKIAGIEGICSKEENKTTISLPKLELMDVFSGDDTSQDTYAERADVAINNELSEGESSMESNGNNSSTFNTKVAKNSDDVIAQWKPSLECELCSKKYSTYSLLQHHFLNTHPLDKCYIVCCQNKFYQRYTIEGHIRHHMGRNAFVCKLCEKRYNSGGSLAAHMRKYHSKSIAGSSKKFCYWKYATYSVETKKFTCLIATCRKELSATCKSNLKRHYRLVHNIVIDGDETLPSGIEKNYTVPNLETTLNRAEFLKCCIGLLSKKNLPFRIFDDKDFFKKMLQPYEEKFEMSLNSKNMSKILGDSSQGIKRAIAKIIENKMISLKIDIASRQDKHILGVNIHYIRDFKLCINTIGMIQLNKRHTAEYLKEEIMKCLEEYNIGINQIYSNTGDNGANVVEVSKLLQELQDENLTTAEEDDELTNTNTYNAIETQLSSVLSVVRCAAHMLQLAAYDVIGTLETEIKEVRDIAKKIRTIVRTGNQDISLPCLDNTSRWNSTYDMIISILNLRQYISDLDDFTNISVNWIFVESFAIAFKPLAECTIHMQKEQYILGDFFRDWLKCEVDLEDMTHTNSHAGALYKAMVIRRRTLLEHDAFVAALYLDPRFNFQGTPLLTNDQKKTAMDHLLKTYEIINHISHSTSTQGESENISFSEYPNVSDNTPSTSNAAYSKLAQHINELVNTSNLNATNQNHHIKSELLAICEKRREPLGIDVLRHWEQLSQRSLNLTQLVEVILAVPATHVSVQRTFSALATVLTNSRSKLSNKSLSNIVITKLNFDMLDCSDLTIENSE